MGPLKVFFHTKKFHFKKLEPNTKKYFIYIASSINEQAVDETVISININNVNFRELAPHNKAHPFIVSNKDQTTDNSAQQLLKATLILRRYEGGERERCEVTAGGSSRATVAYFTLFIDPTKLMHQPNIFPLLVSTCPLH